MSDSDRDYHLHRARTEEQAAQRSVHGAAAEAHRRLSAMHAEMLDDRHGSSPMQRAFSAVTTFIRILKRLAGSAG